MANYCELKTIKRCLIKAERLQAVEKSHIYGLTTDLGLYVCIKLSAQAFHLSVNHVDSACLWILRQSWHTHDVAHNHHYHLSAIVDYHLAHGHIKSRCDVVCLGVG